MNDDAIPAANQGEVFSTHEHPTDELRQGVRPRSVGLDDRGHEAAPATGGSGEDASDDEAGERSNRQGDKRQASQVVVTSPLALPFGITDPEVLSQIGFEPGTTQVVQVSQTHQGPLPPPDMLAGYGDIDPSFPNRIMAIAEQRQALEVRVVQEQMERQREMVQLGRLTIENEALVTQRAARDEGFAVRSAGFTLPLSVVVFGIIIVVALILNSPWIAGACVVFEASIVAIPKIIHELKGGKQDQVMVARRGVPQAQPDEEG